MFYYFIFQYSVTFYPVGAFCFSILAGDLMLLVLVSSAHFHSTLNDFILIHNIMLLLSRVESLLIKYEK